MQLASQMQDEDGAWIIIVDHDDTPTSKPLPVIREGEWPLDALQWRSRAEKSRALRLWRRSVARTFTTTTRPVRLALVLTGLFSDAGYCFASNSHLSAETGMPGNKVQEGLLELEAAGAIVRATTSLKDPNARRIFAGKRIVEAQGGTPDVGGTPPPPACVTGAPPALGVQNTKKRTSFTTTSKKGAREQAQLEAERRAAKERGEVGPRWFDDE